MKKQLMIMGLLVAALMTAMAPVVDAAKATVKTKEACKNGGWMSLVDEDGAPFTSEKACKGFAKAGETPGTILAIAYANLDGTDGYDAGQDVLIAEFVDDDGSPGPNAGDHIVMGQYPTKFTPTAPADFADFGVRRHLVTGVDAHNPGVLQATSSQGVYAWLRQTSIGQGRELEGYGEVVNQAEVVRLTDGLGFRAFDVLTIGLDAPSQPTVVVEAERANPGDDAFLNVIIN